MLRPLLVLAFFVLAFGGCRKPEVTPFPQVEAAVIGGRKVPEARAAPHHIGASGAQWKTFVPCSEARYIGFTARLGGVGASLTVQAIGAKVIQLRVEFLDADAQPVFQRRYDIPAEATTVEPRASFTELAGGKGRPPRGDYFLRLTAENPHCRGLEVLGTIRD